MNARRIAAAAFAATIASALAAPAFAQSWPAKPVRFVLPGSPGSSPDRVVRLLADRLGAQWNQSVIVDNRPGATGTIGAELVAKSPADGYTLVFAFTSIVQAPALMARVPYDVDRDFVPVTLVNYAPTMLAVRADSPIRSLADYVAAAKTTPITYGTFGNGSTYHIYGETLRIATGTKLTMVPYRGEALSMADLLGGQIESSWASSALVAPHVRAGKARVLAVALPERTPALPDVPTFTELGYPALGTVSWFGILAPAGTPRPIVDRIATDVNAIIAQPDVAKTLRDGGLEPAGTTPARFAEIIRIDVPRWKKMIEDAGIKAE